MRFVGLIPVVLSTLAGVAVSGDSGAAQPVDIFVVMADDAGLGDIGHYHRQRTGEQPLVPTIALDALAEAGMRFSDAHSSTALCSPARCSIMCGNHTYRSYAPWGV